MEILRVALCAAVALTSLAAPARAADYSAPQEGDWIAKDFKFHTGEVMPELKLHYTTVGEPTGQPVLVLHDDRFGIRISNLSLGSSRPASASERGYDANVR